MRITKLYMKENFVLDLPYLRVEKGISRGSLLDRFRTPSVKKEREMMSDSEMTR